MKKKFLLPMMAFVFAIGLSFATERSTADAQNDWVGELGSRTMIEEVDCGPPAVNCSGRFEENGQLYEIYDGPTDETPKQGAGELEELLIRA